MATQALRFWRRHRWTVVRSLLLAALLHRFNCCCLLVAASSPVVLLTAFLLGVVLVHSEPNVPLAPAEDEDRHLYKKIRHITAAGSNSSSDDDESSGGVSSVEELEEERLVGNKEEAVAWTAEDEHSILSIGSLELERDARLEKLMSRRSSLRVHSQHRPETSLLDLDVHIPARVLVAPRKKNPFDLPHCCYYDDDFPGSAPSSLLRQHSNPFHVQRGQEEMLRRHESFTAGARRSRLRPYFVADVDKEGGGDACSDNDDKVYNKFSSSSSSSSSSSAGSDHQKQQEAKAAAAVSCKGDDGNNGTVAVDVELISDSSDDDMSLPGDDDAAAVSLAMDAPEQSDEDDSFEVESITQQVAAGNQQQQLIHVGDDSQPHPDMAAGPGYDESTRPSSPPQLHRQEKQEEGATSKEEEVAWVAPSTLASVEENVRREREVSEIREHHILGLVDDDSSPGAGAGAAEAPPAAAAGKSSSKSKAPYMKKVAVFGFFRK